MSDQQSETNSQFTRKSAKESICTYCFQTVKTDRYAPLEKAEDIHADVCLSKPNFGQRYSLL
jgi:hypothetical protein